MQNHCRVRRTVLGAFVIAALVGGVPAVAQTFPSKPVHIVVPFPPGGGTDAVARLFADKMSGLLGQPVVVENKGGAGSIIGASAVANAAADGYTLLLSASNVYTTNRYIYNKLPYAPQDLKLIYQVATIPQVLVVTPDIPANTAPEFVEFLKSGKRVVAYGSYGIGSYPHLAGAYLSKNLKVEMTHVAYKGEAPILQDMLSGNLHMTIASAMGVKPFVQTGKMKALGVTGEQRIGILAHVPTLKEQGLNESAFRALGWLGIALPAGTPKPVVVRLHDAIQKTAQMPDVRQRLDGMGFRLVTDSTPEKITEIVERDLPVWKSLLDVSGAKFE